MDNLKLDNLKLDILAIKNKIAECRTNNITDAFSIEMNIMENLPELYSQYPYLIKKLLNVNHSIIFLKSYQNFLRLLQIIHLLCFFNRFGNFDKFLFFLRKVRT